ncbi:MAG: CAP domain-containing protein [Bacteroidetes bacterium]|nr:MAG: CAP domain-containing protein [Bacteroidota bacterium]
MMYRFFVFTLLTLAGGFVGFAQSQEVAYEVCEMEKEFIAIFLSDPNQQRTSPKFDATLHRIAREKAREMAQRRYFNHTSPDGIGPNHLLREAGYGLPNHYGKALDANNVESLLVGASSAPETYEGWMQSPAGHRKHILGEIDFWRKQTRFGIGYYYDLRSPYMHYWVFISAPPATLPSH